MASALGDVLRQNSAVSIAAIVGINETTVARRGEEPSQWPATDLLALANEFPALSGTIVDFLVGKETPRAEAAAAVGDAINVIERGAELMRVLADAIRDGRFTQAEDLTVAATAASLMEMLPALVRDVHAAAMRNR